MIHFQSVDLKTFLTDYWQKKPLVIRQALPDFIAPLNADELAGLSLEDDIESRIVLETPGEVPAWHLKRGPFLDTDYAHLPKTHWTLLVQGVDRVIPEVADLFAHFDFIPSWRVDDVMISYAAKQGSVGPHYDNYDVFLYQASGRREWSLTTKDCHENNYLTDVPLRIMAKFQTEDTYILEEGDLLYLPPHVGHYGISLSDDCMTYSFGYRSYPGQELWDSLGDYWSEKNQFTEIYRDPNWADLKNPSEIPRQAWLNAKMLMQQKLDDETQLKSWFGCFATRLDPQAEALLPTPLTEDEFIDILAFTEELLDSSGLVREANCRIAYHTEDLELFINGCVWNIDGVSCALVKQVANHRLLEIHDLIPFLDNEEDCLFLFELWKLQWLHIEPGSSLK